MPNKDEDLTGRIELFFLDSGAYSIFHRKAEKLEKINGKTVRKVNYGVYRSKGFARFLKGYAEFIKANAKYLHFYANLDAILHPELSWRSYEILTREYGLKPVPVIHPGTDLSYVEKYLADGCSFIGLGGFASKVMSRSTYIKWVSSVFDMITDGPDNVPFVRVHGFAMTSWRMMYTFPWWSVDSASWLKAAAYGGVYIPPYVGGEYRFDLRPMSVQVSTRSPGCLKDNLESFQFGYDAEKLKKKGTSKHITTWSPSERVILERWCEFTGLPMGSENEKGEVLEKGLLTDFNLRAHANLLYFEAFRKALPDWPNRFVTKTKKDLGLFRIKKTTDIRPELEPVPESDAKPKIFYSGVSSTKVNPEVMIPHKNPSVMLSYFDFHDKNTTATKRFKTYQDYKDKDV